LVLVLACLATSGAAPRADEPVLLNEQPGGILELEGERRFQVTGLRGMLTLRLGKPGELRYAVRRLEASDEEQPVALWLDGRTLRLTRREGAADVAVRLEVALAPELSAEVEAVDSDVIAAGLHGEVGVAGERLRAAIRNIDGSLELDLVDSEVEVLGVNGPLVLDGRQLEGSLESLNGRVTVNATEGRLRLGQLRDELAGFLENVDLAADHVVGRVELEADGGRLALSACEAGARLILTDTPLELRGCTGPVEVETDVDVQVQLHEGPLTIRALAGSVRGTQIKGGALEIETRDGQVLLEQLEASTSIRGTGLDVQVKDTKADLSISTSGAHIVVEKAHMMVNVDNEFGDVEIREAASQVNVFNFNGDVRIEALKGSAQVEADAPSVEVHWSSLGGHEASSVENVGGDVRVSLPSRFRAQLDAQAPHGRIETDLDEVRVSADGHFASGLLLGGRGPAPHVKRPSIRLKAAGDLYVMEASPVSPQR
jgi:DUF4097 and DUF4098 domain-containing protein YvlB